MNKRFSIQKLMLVLTFLFALVVFVGCKEDPTLSFDKANVEIAVGESFTLTPTITNLEGSDLVDYAFDKEGIIEKSGENSFIGKSNGTVTITASLKGYEKITFTITVEVVKQDKKVTSINVTGKTALVLPETVTLEAEVLPADADNKEVEWKSSDETVATVSNKGVVTPLKAGTVTIEAIAKDGSNVKGSITLTIDEEVKVVLVSKINLKAETTEITAGDTVKLTAEVLPENADNKEIEWKSSDEKTALVDEKGVVTAIKAGTVTIEAVAKDGSNAKGSITLVIKEEVILIEMAFIYAPEGISYFLVGQTYQVDYMIDPEDSTAFKFVSSDETVATIDSEGKFTCLKSGFVTFSIETTDGSEISSSTAELRVVDMVTDIEVTGEATMEQGTTQRLIVKLLPSTAVANPLYESSNPEVADVSGQGIVEAKQVGETTITIKSSDGSTVTKEFKIKVIEPLVDAAYTLADPKVADLTDSTRYTYNGIEFVVGFTAFPTLKQALSVATEKVYVAAGTYNENVTIEKSNIQVLGPNSGINPNTITRLEEAVITGKITIGNSLENIVINGFAFTEGGSVKGGDLCKNIQVSYNNVYNTSEGSAAWTEARVEADSVFNFWVALNGNETDGIEIIYNKFENIKKTGVLVARVKNVTVSNNVFHNFTHEAIRGEGGYNYGKWTFDNNTFKNDQKQAYNGIYLQSVSGAENGKCQEIYITNSLFENIGEDESTSSYNGAISMRTYQEAGLKCDILYNTFRNCNNYLALRNNGATKDSYESNVNFNAFYGVPTGVYHRNCAPGTSDTASSNPPLTNMDYNLFVDDEGNVLTDLSAYSDKFVDLASYANPFASKAEYEARLKALLGVEYEMIVNPEWKDKNAGDIVEAEGFTWTFGTDAFASLDDCLSKLDEGKTIKVLAGNYSEAINITINGIKLVGPNQGVNAQYANRDAEAVIAAVITVGENVEDFTIDGFEFTGAGQVVLSKGAKNITVRYNVINATAADGLVRSSGDANAYVYDVKFNNNYSANYKGNRVLHLTYIENLEVLNNYIDCDSSYDFLNVQGVIGGKVVFKDNTYIKSNQSFIYAVGVNAIDALIQGNYLEDIANTIIDFRTMKQTDTAEATFSILNNTFVDAGCSWCPIRIRTAGYKESDSIAINVNYNKFIDSYYEGDVPQFVENPSYDSQVDPFKVIYNMDNNYYEIDGNAVTELTATHFSDAALSWENTYASEDDMPVYVKENEVLPTAVQITNKISEIGAYESHQLTFKVSPDDATNKKVAFKSSDTSVATVSTAGVINAKSGGTCTITVYSVADSTILDEMKLTVTPKERIEIRYEGNGVIKTEDSLKLNVTVYGGDGTPTYTSSDKTIATVDADGKVTAVKEGQVKITVTLGELSAEVGLTIIDKNKEMSDLLKLLVDGSNGVILRQEIVYIGSDDGSADYAHDIYGAANDFWAGTNPETIRNMLPSDRDNFDGKTMESVEFIVFHDTAGSPSTSTAQANSGWCTNSSNNVTSWHYTIGNDGIYQQLEDTQIGWHAGDGTNWAATTPFYDTGIKYNGERPEVTIGDDGYFYVAGQKSLVKAPEGTKELNDLGMVIVKGENGNYFIPETWVCNQYGTKICARGGGINGIGIESAVNLGSDVYLTWQMSAKFIAQLLIKHNLTPDRVWFHNNFTNKHCPNTMMTADLVDIFLEMVYIEYDVAKNYADYEITFVSDNPEIMDNTGRIVNKPDYTTNVSYTITITKDGKSESIKLNTLVVGLYN